MKVCTDACLFGAWVAQVASTHLPIKNVLDIGTGTGLLALMVAQKNNAIIDGIEIDEAAADQALQNIKASPWSNRINIYNKPVQNFLPIKKYELIISNPPFFEGDLKSVDSKRNLALHSAALSFTELLNIAATNITADGLFAVLVPFARTDEFLLLAKQQHFYLHKKAFVQPTPTHSYFRSMVVLGKCKAEASEETITIKDLNNNYTPAFVELLKDYYLHL